MDEAELQLNPEPERGIVERVVFSLDVSALACCGCGGEHFLRERTRTVSSLTRVSKGAGRRISVIERGNLGPAGDFPEYLRGLQGLDCNGYK